MTDSARPRTRNVLVVDNSHVARRVGDRIRQARQRASLTQAEVARGRYTAAYISALERGLAKPSMAALTFLSERLGVPIPDLVAEDRPAARRLEADLLMASGKVQEALDRYDGLLENAGDDRRQRADLLRGRAEALSRLGRAHDAIRPAAEAAEIFDGLGSAADAASARYWLATAHHRADNTAEARGILQELLAAERRGLQVAPDFGFRVLTTLASVEASDGQAERALGYMDEARILLRDASLRQRAAFLAALALQHKRAGDLERSISVGHESLALFRSADAEVDEANLEVRIASTYLEIDRTDQAAAHLDRARELAVRGDDRGLLSEVEETEARLAFARGDDSTARERSEAALSAMGEGGSYAAAVGACVTLARVAHRSGDRRETESRFEQAAALLRDRRARTQLREVLAEWADVRSGWGDAEGANALYSEALGRTTGGRRPSSRSAEPAGSRRRQPPS
jgi:transcriptional regulator with XRE-family HTH domain